MYVVYKKVKKTVKYIEIGVASSCIVAGDGPLQLLALIVSRRPSSKKNLLCTTKIFDGQITLQNNMASLRGCQIELWTKECAGVFFSKLLEKSYFFHTLKKGNIYEHMWISKPNSYQTYCPLRSKRIWKSFILFFFKKNWF